MAGTVASPLHVAGLSLDCADPAALGAFYQQLVGGEITWSNVDSVGVRARDVLLIAQRVSPYVPPVWPGTSIVHLDFSADPALDTAVARAGGFFLTRPGTRSASRP